MLFKILQLVILLTTLDSVISQVKKETWKQELSSVKIGVSVDGFTRAVVDCGTENIAFIISMEEDFGGVIYTRGSFHAKDSPCFKDVNKGKDFAFKIPYKKCGVIEEDDSHSVTVVVQFDDDLIFPGDLAFRLTCSDPQEERDIRSRITLVDADPAEADQQDGDLYQVSSETGVATLYPPKLHQEL